MPDVDPWASATEQAEVIGGFTVKLITWLSLFAQSLAEHWRSRAYKKARLTSGHAAERDRKYMEAGAAGDAAVDEYL